MTDATPTAPTNAAPKPPRDLVFLDVETTGLDPAQHEILEVAAIRVTHDLQHIRTFAAKVAPTRLHTASPEALAINGYDPAAWTHALTLADALDALWPLLDGAIPAGHNIGFDLGFLEAAAASTGRSPLPTDYHRLDTASLGWLCVTSGESTSWSLSPVCEALGVRRTEEHRALADAQASLEVARRVRERWVGAAPTRAREGLVAASGPEITALAKIVPLPRKFGGDA